MSILQKCIIDRCKIYIEYNIKLMWLKAEYIFPFSDKILLMNGIINTISNKNIMNENTQL